MAWLFQWDDGQPGEDCLRLNVWTPGLSALRTAKRPVMVWLHGGGFQAGSGHELPSYHGENLARRGDVVVVTVNHRLNVFGHLFLAEYDSRYASSGNAGILDLILALEWVRDNIAAFGGDPGNVTIFGQSGGGGKVNALLAMPAAKGLFHKAIVQSGSALRLSTPDLAAKLAAATLAELNLSRNQLDRLHELPAQTLVMAAVAARNKVAPRPAVLRLSDMGRTLGWAPVVDGRDLPRHPFDPDAPQVSAHVPLIAGTTMNEFVSAMGNPAMEQMTEAELEKRAAEVWKDRAPEVLAAFRKANPGAKPLDLLSLMSTAPVRQAAIDQVERKAALRAAPAWNYWFCWKTPVLDGGRPLVPLPRAAVRLRQRRAVRAHDRRRRARPGAGAAHERGLDPVCAHRRPEPQRHPALAGLGRGRTGDDDLRRRLCGEERPGPRRARAGGQGLGGAKAISAPWAGEENSRLARVPVGTPMTAAGTIPMSAHEAEEAGSFTRFFCETQPEGLRLRPPACRQPRRREGHRREGLSAPARPPGQVRRAGTGSGVVERHRPQPRHRSPAPARETG